MRYALMALLVLATSPLIAKPAKKVHRKPKPRPAATQQMEDAAWAEKEPTEEPLEPTVQLLKNAPVKIRRDKDGNPLPNYYEDDIRTPQTQRKVAPGVTPARARQGRGQYRLNRNYAGAARSFTSSRVSKAKAAVPRITYKYRTRPVR